LTAVQRCPEFFVAPCRQSGCAVEIGIARTIRVLTAELEHQPSVPYPFGNFLSGAHRSGKRHQVDIRVIDHRVS
jgi:hypothetical protein